MSNEISFDNIQHTSENVYQIMREDESWTKDALVDYIIDLEKIVNEWWEEKQKEYVKAVRCKDCRWRGDDEYCDKYGFYVCDDEFFCRGGERDDDE